MKQRMRKWIVAARNDLFGAAVLAGRIGDGYKEKEQTCHWGVKGEYCWKGTKGQGKSELVLVEIAGNSFVLGATVRLEFFFLYCGFFSDGISFSGIMSWRSLGSFERDTGLDDMMDFSLRRNDTLQHSRLRRIVRM